MTDEELGKLILYVAEMCTIMHTATSFSDQINGQEQKVLERFRKDLAEGWDSTQLIEAWNAVDVLDEEDI